MVARLSLLLALASTLAVGLAASKAEWRSRTLYQVVTDRFARGDGSTSQCNDLSDYCGALGRRQMPLIDRFGGVATGPRPGRG